MPRKKKVTFLAKTKIKRRVSFEAEGRDVSFKAKVPSKRRRRVTFYSD